MAITSVLPNRGGEGTDVIIDGNGFNNATGVTFGDVPAAWLKVSDVLIRATVPPNAVAGKVVVLDPDGNQESPTDFDLTVSALPQNTTRGRSALDALTLLIAAMVRTDYDGVSRFLSPTFFTSLDGVQTERTKPDSKATPSEIAAFNLMLESAIPINMDGLQNIQLVNDAVSIWFGGDLRNTEDIAIHILLRNTSAGYRVAQIVTIKP